MFYILFILPFIVVLNSKDKINGFLSSFSIYSIYILVSTLVLQYFNVFTRVNLAILIGLYAIASIVYFIKKERHLRLTFDWKIVAIFSIFLLYLFLPNLRDYPDTYLYPFYSDEWVNFGLSNFSVLHNSLPTFNYLAGTSFINFLIPFHSFNSFFLLFFDWGIKGFVVLGKIFNFGILAAAYVLLRKKLNASKIASILAVTGMLFITSSSSVTGLWHFITLNLSFLFLMLSFIRNIHLNSLLSVLFYPPISILVLFRYIYVYRFKALKYIAPAAALFFTVLLFESSLQIYATKIFDLLVRPSVYSGYEKVSIFDMLPLLATPFIFVGFIAAFINKKRELLYVSLFCSAFWVYYSFNSQILIMDKVRFVTLSCWFMMIFCALGIDYVYENYGKDYLKENLQKYFYGTLIILLLLGTGLYAYSNENLKLGLQLPNGQMAYVSDVINAQYNEGDKEIFDTYVKDKRFMSTAWKSLILASITEAKPLNTKPSYLTVNKLYYEEFIHADCDTQRRLARKNKMNYFYGNQFTCREFKYITYNPSNNLYLYEFKGK